MRRGNLVKYLILFCPCFWQSLALSSKMYPSWQSTREHTSDYTARNPWDSPLYRIVYHYRDEFEYNYGELFEESYGFLRQEVLEAFDRFLNCGILRHGCARAWCENCEHSILIAFSCKRRGLCVPPVKQNEQYFLPSICTSKYYINSRIVTLFFPFRSDCVFTFALTVPCFSISTEQSGNVGMSMYGNNSLMEKLVQ